MTPALDHLVVIADSLDEGVAWCERTLGVTPGTGGEHPLMGTHNRLLRIDSPHWPRAYLEIIAINKVAIRPESAIAHRWFDMDNALLKAQIARAGPQLAHWVARVPDAARAVDAWRVLAIERGEPILATRPTPAGLLSWQITLRPDGARLLEGCLPTLIQWGDVHPVDNMPASGLRLERLEIEHPQAQLLNDAFDAVGLGQVHAVPSAQPTMCAHIVGPRGWVALRSLA